MPQRGGFRPGVGNRRPGPGGRRPGPLNGVMNMCAPQCRQANRCPSESDYNNFLKNAGLLCKQCIQRTCRKFCCDSFAL